MCLGIPGRVVAVAPEQQKATIETFGLRREVATSLVEDVNLGDYLMVHAGYAIEKIDLQEAEERIKLWEEILADELGEIPGPGTFQENP